MIRILLLAMFLSGCTVPANVCIGSCSQGNAKPDKKIGEDK
jgi:hypothetical protein